MVCNLGNLGFIVSCSPESRRQRKQDMYVSGGCGGQSQLETGSRLDGWRAEEDGPQARGSQMHLSLCDPEQSSGNDGVCREQSLLL